MKKYTFCAVCVWSSGCTKYKLCTQLNSQIQILFSVKKYILWLILATHTPTNLVIQIQCFFSWEIPKENNNKSKLRLKHSLYVYTLLVCLHSQ